MRAALLKVAQERFAEQQRSAGEAALVAPISPSPPGLVEATLECLWKRGTLAKTGEGAASPGAAPVRLLDLGCGDARWLTAACGTYACVGVGYDVDDALLAKGRAAIARLGLGAVATVERRDFLEPGLDLFRDGDVVVAYLFRDGVARLAAKLEAELSRGVVVCIGFELRGWRPACELAVHGIKARVYDVGGAS